MTRISTLNIPRKIIPLVWAILVFLIQVILPWCIANLGVRHGWYSDMPSNVNLLGLIPVTAGVAGDFCLLSSGTNCLLFWFPVRGSSFGN